VQLLAQLQRVDSAIDHDRGRLATVELQLADNSALAAAEAEHTATTAVRTQQQTELRDLELEVQDLRSRLTALEKKLYGGTVVNPKELAAMTDDARQYRNQISPREDRILELYDLVDAAVTAQAEADKQLAAARAADEDRKRQLHDEEAALQRRLAAAEQERDTLRREADPQALRLYDSLRRTKGGLAVAEVAQRTCQGCRVSVPANLEARARTSDELVLCQSCGRILHAGV
jgi:predicted  nucleic acid-binding Zn-ribbon protein